MGKLRQRCKPHRRGRPCCPTGVLPALPVPAGRAPVPCAARARWVFPPGDRIKALAPAKATTQQPLGDGAEAAFPGAGNTFSSIISPWL